MGELGPREGDDVVYDWRWYYSAGGLTLWVVLLLTMVVPKANRRPQVLLILIPVVIVSLLWRAVTRVLPAFSTSDNEMFRALVQCLVVELAALWLLGHALARGGRLKTFLGALVIEAGIAFVAVLSFSLGSLGAASQLPFILGMLTLAIVLGFALAGLMCRKRYIPVRFGLFLALWTVACSTASMFLLFVGWCVATSFWPGHTGQVAVSVTLAGAVFGACVFLAELPFLIVGLKTPLFRERFVACLRLNRPAQESGNGFASDAAPLPMLSDESSA